MAIDPFEHFGEQQRSHELLGQHRDMLLADARELLREHPNADVVGLILDGDASEAAAMRQELERAAGRSLQGRGFVGVAPRQFVLQILRINAPAMLDWLPASRQDGVHMLPLAAITKSGMRFGAVRLDPEG